MITKPTIPQAQEQIIASRRKGKTLAEVAAETGRSTTEVATTIADANLPPLRSLRSLRNIDLTKVRSMHSEGASTAHIAKETSKRWGVIATALETLGLQPNQCKRGNKPRISRREVSDLLAEGCSQSEISRRLNCTRAAISLICIEMKNSSK